MKRPPLVILAGGKGTRLGTLTTDTPKPMIDVLGKPFLYWLIKHYVSQGFTDITVSTGYKAEVIRAYMWPWALRFCEDSQTCSVESWYDSFLCDKRWVVNGDTFIPDFLPECHGRQSCILTCNDIDAGAQLVTYGKIVVHKVSSFYDIGTPKGLEQFKEYFTKHPLYIQQLTKKQ